MPYGDDITEGIPYNLSNPTNASRNFQLTGESYDVSIGGLPFYIMSSDETPYRRQTAQYRKQQIDQTNEAGEQTLTGWWLRSQSSFHAGSGINFYDPAAGETVQYRFADSHGVNVWNKGEVTLLKNVVDEHITTGAVTGTDHQHPNQHTRSIQWSGTEGVLLHDEYDVDKISADGTVTHFVDYLEGGAEPVRAICDDGVNAYWVTNKVAGGANKLHMYKKPLTGTSASTADETLMFTATGLVIQYATMEFIKDRIILCVNNAVYELTTTAASLGTPVFTNTNTNYHYTSIAASGPAIYTAGHSGIYSTIQKYTLSTAGALPTLTSAVVAAELPAGEIIEKIYYYLGYMMIGTNKGVRASIVSDQDGSINYGPLIVETSQPVYDFSGRDKFVWAASGIGALNGGLTRVNLSQEIEPLRFAYANDLEVTQSTEHYTTAVAFLGTTNRLAFTTAHNSTNGAIYLESATDYVPSGYITTGKIRYNTLESKLFKLLTVRLDNVNGGLTVKSIGTDSAEYNIGGFAEDDIISELSVSYPAGSQEFLSFKFTLTRSEGVNTGTPILKGYQVKSLPAVPRQRLIQYPLACYDNEKDTYGTVSGYENSAYDRLTTIEALENIGDSLRVEDYRNGESYVGLIEEIQFLNRTPSDKRFSGFGGVLYVTVRSL